MDWSPSLSLYPLQPPWSMPYHLSPDNFNSLPLSRMLARGVMLKAQVRYHFPAEKSIAAFPSSHTKIQPPYHCLNVSCPLLPTRTLPLPHYPTGLFPGPGPVPDLDICTCCFTRPSALPPALCMPGSPLPLPSLNYLYNCDHILYWSSLQENRMKVQSCSSLYPPAYSGAPNT